MGSRRIIKWSVGVSMALHAPSPHVHPFGQIFTRILSIPPLLLSFLISLSLLALMSRNATEVKKNDYVVCKRRKSECLKMNGYFKRCHQETYLTKYLRYDCQYDVGFLNIIHRRSRNGGTWTVLWVLLLLDLNKLVCCGGESVVKLGLAHLKELFEWKLKYWSRILDILAR